MKLKILSLIITLLLLVGSIGVAGDAQIASGDPRTQSLRHYYVTGAAAVSASLSIPSSGTQIFELVSIDIHLSAVGAAGNLTITKNSGLGAAYDTNLITQNMTSVTDLLIMYEPGEAIFSNLDSIDFVWANASARTYGITVKYKVK